MAAQRKVRRATARETASISFFKQNDQRRDEIMRMLAGPRRSADALPLQPHERDPVAQYMDLLPKGRGAAKTLSFIRRFGARGAEDAGLPPLRIPTTAIANSFKLEVLDGIHLAADVYKIALYVAASTIGASTTVYTTTNEVVGVGYTAGGMNLAGRSAALDGSTAVLDWTTDPVWSNATITARGCMIYNSTRANRTVSVHDFGADVSSTNGNFTVQFPLPTAAAGLVRIA